MKKYIGIALAVLMVLGLATMGMATTEVDVDGTTTSGSFEFIAHNHSGTLDIWAREYYGSDLSSSNEFHAWGSYDATYKTKGICHEYLVPSYHGNVLTTSIQAHTNSYGGFSTQFYQDFDLTGYGTFEGLVVAYVEGNNGAEMNLVNSGGERSLQLTTYPSYSFQALSADGTGGTFLPAPDPLPEGYTPCSYRLGSYTVVGQDVFGEIDETGEYIVEPNIEAESNIFVSGTDGQAWMGLGCGTSSNDKGEIGHQGPSTGCISACGPLGNPGGTNLYVDAGSGYYSHHVQGEDYLNFAGGLYPGGGDFWLSGTFDDGMHATPWASAN